MWDDLPDDMLLLILQHLEEREEREAWEARDAQAWTGKRSEQKSLRAACQVCRQFRRVAMMLDAFTAIQLTGRGRVRGRGGEAPARDDVDDYDECDDYPPSLSTWGVLQLDKVVVTPGLFAFFRKFAHKLKDVRKLEFSWEDDSMQNAFHSLSCIAAVKEGCPSLTEVEATLTSSMYGYGDARWADEMGRRLVSLCDPQRKLRLSVTRNGDASVPRCVESVLRHGGAVLTSLDLVNVSPTMELLTPAPGSLPAMRALRLRSMSVPQLAAFGRASHALESIGVLYLFQKDDGGDEVALDDFRVDWFPCVREAHVILLDGRIGYNPMVARLATIASAQKEFTEVANFTRVQLNCEHEHVHAHLPAWLSRYAERVRGTLRVACIFDPGTLRLVISQSFCNCAVAIQVAGSCIPVDDVARLVVFGTARSVTTLMRAMPRWPPAVDVRTYDDDVGQDDKSGCFQNIPEVIGTDLGDGCVVRADMIASGGCFADLRRAGGAGLTFEFVRRT